MSESNKDLIMIVRDANSKGFKNKEIDVLKTVYDLAMVEYVQHNPYTVYRDNIVDDKIYFDNQRTYAAAKAREYVTRTIDEWQRNK